MNWDRIPYFLAVVRNGSLRAAASSMGGTHATVDRNLRALETAYGVRLFERSRAGLVLTSAGEALVPLAEEAERAVIASGRRLQGMDKDAAGRVRLSIPTPFATAFLPPILARFERAHPRIDLEIHVTNRFEDIARSETDVSIRIAHQVDDDVVRRKIFQYARGIYASQDYLERHFADAGPEGDGLTWIGWGDPARLPDWVRQSPFPRAAIRHAVSEVSLMKSLVQAGVGMCYLPVSAAYYLPELVQVPGTELKLDRSIWLLLHPDLRGTTRVRLLVDHLVGELRALRPMFLGSLA